MNKQCKEKKNSLNHSPLLFDDEEVDASSSDEVKMIKICVTPHSKSYLDHSTPIQTTSKTDCCDSPDLNYNQSPIEPLTQHPPNEVGWDYQRLIIKEDGVKPSMSMEINKTPKRSVLFHKKRNSNSPLLYKPLKKKLMQDEQQENIAGFMAELKAIEMKAKKIGEKNMEVLPKTEDDSDNQLIIELNDQPLDYFDRKLQVSAVKEESPVKKKANVRKSYNALLDDSIEDIMVLCSQEVEAKEFRNTKMEYIASNNSSEENIFSKTSTNSSANGKMCDNFSKENHQYVNNNEKVIADRNPSLKQSESGSLEIPDDSFDEFFVSIDDKDIDKNENNEICIDSIYKSVISDRKPSTKYKSATVASIAHKINTVPNKFFQSKNSTYITQLKNTSSTNCNYLKNFQASNASVQNKVINTKASFGYLNKNYVRNNNSSGFDSQTQTSDSSSSSKSSDTRLLKSKSYSDSNFLHKNNSNINIGNNRMTNFNFNVYSNQQIQQSKNSVNKNVKSNHHESNYSLQSKTWRRIQSSPSIDKSSIKQHSSVNRLSNGEESQSLSTAAEIERKRQEAIMKREARLKMKFDNMLLKRPIQYPIKR